MTPFGPRQNQPFDRHQDNSSIFGIISLIAGLFLMVLIGPAVYYHVSGSVPVPGDSVWGPLIGFIDTMIQIAFDISTFLLAFLLFTPLLWVFIRRRRKVDDTL
jgi:hypothetical protein